jgi:hypothetical protein
MSRGAKEKPRVSLWAVCQLSQYNNRRCSRIFVDSPVADAKTCDAVCHLDDDELATALHLARLTLPDLYDDRSSVVPSGSPLR